MFCPNCGTENSTDLKFCTSCGGSLQSTTQVDKSKPKMVSGITVGSLLSQTVNVTKGNFGQSFLIAFIGLLIVLSLHWVFGDIKSYLGIVVEPIIDFSIAAVILFLIDLVSGALISGAIIYGTMKYLSGTQATTSQCIAAGCLVCAPYFVATSLAFLGSMLGMILLIVPGMILMTMWILVGPIIVVERPGVFASFRRSRALTKGARWKILWVLLIYFLFVVGINFSIDPVAKIIFSSLIPFALFKLIVWSITYVVLSVLVYVIYVALSKVKGAQ